MQSQTEQLHQSMGMVREAPPLVVRPPAPVSDSEGEHDFSDQLLETWMLLEYCDQGNLESAAREARFKKDFVSACCPYCHCLYYMHADVDEHCFAALVTRRSPAQLKLYSWIVSMLLKCLLQGCFLLTALLSCAGNHLPLFNGHRERNGLPAFPRCLAWCALAPACTSVSAFLKHSHLLATLLFQKHHKGRDCWSPRPAVLDWMCAWRRGCEGCQCLAEDHCAHII